MVTGIRKDPQAQQMDRRVIREKRNEAVGSYFNPAAYGKSRDRSTIQSTHPELMKSIQKASQHTKDMKKKQ